MADEDKEDIDLFVQATRVYLSGNSGQALFDDAIGGVGDDSAQRVFLLLQKAGWLRESGGLGKDRSTLVEKADKTFEDASAAVTPAARSLIARLRPIEDPPDEAGIEFGVQLSAQTGAFIASVAAEANFTMSMTWRRRAAET
jgi:hypothetical protein